MGLNQIQNGLLPETTLPASLPKFYKSRANSQSRACVYSGQSYELSHTDTNELHSVLC